MRPDPFSKPPYIDWRLDRWKLTLLALLFGGLLCWVLFAPA
jgi:hypothetical protein